MTLRRSRGFSVLELVLALGLSGLVFTAVMGLLVTTARARRQAQEEARLLRSADIALLRLQRDLSFAQTGLPADWGGAGVAPGDAELGLIGDFPAPGALYPTLGVLIDRADERRDLLMWRTANAPGLDACGGKPCSYALFGPTQGCDRTGSGADEGGSLHCPWGSGRASPGALLHVVTEGGMIGHATVDGPQLRLACPGGACGLQLKGAVQTPGGEPLDVGEQLAWVTTPDGVRWWLEEGVLYRRQCALRLLPAGVDGQVSCAEPERVARGVTAFFAERRDELVVVTLELSADVVGTPISVRAVGAGSLGGWR